MGVALLQVTTFSLGLSFGQHLGHQGNEPVTTIETASHDGDGAFQPLAARRPPRWPGRSKNAKGLAIREASAIKPIGIVV